MQSLRWNEQTQKEFKAKLSLIGESDPQRIVQEIKIWSWKWTKLNQSLENEMDWILFAFEIKTYHPIKAGGPDRI